MFNQNQLLKYRPANFIAEYMEVFTPQAIYLSFQHLSLLPLVVHLPLIVAPAHALLPPNKKHFRRRPDVKVRYLCEDVS